jgi:hypothetical protein
MVYYQVRQGSRPKQNGIILRATGKKLEVFAGEGELEDIGASLDKNRLVLKKGYVATRISQYRAKNLRTDFTNWLGLQLWAYGH